MLATFRMLSTILDKREKKHALYIFIFSIFIAIAEAVGVASILPFMMAVTNPEVISTNRYLSEARNLFSALSEQDFLFMLGIVVVILLIFSITIRAVGVWINTRYSQLRSHSISHRLMKAYLSQPYKWYLDKNTSKMGASVLDESAQAVNGVLFPTIQLMSRSLIVVALFSLLIIAQPILSVITLLLIGSLYFVIYFLTRKKLFYYGKHRRLSNQKRFRAANEAFGGIKDIMILGRESSLLEQYRLASQSVASYAIKAKVTSELPPLLMQAFIFVGMISLILYFIALHDGFQEAIPILSLFALAGYRMLPELQSIYRHITEIRISQPVLESISEDLLVLEKSSRKIFEHNFDESIIKKPKLKLEHIYFSYEDSEKYALNDISIEIPAFSSIGIVGTTGSGKTTLVDVILTLLAPSKGQYFVGDVEVSLENASAFRSAIGYVPQSIYLTDNTISQNIAYGVEESRIDHAAVKKAAQIANLDEFITGELIEGYSTIIGEKGVRLSGGQRQRIGIARALYHDPQILIMDEATSALDNVTEKAVMDAVHNLSKRKTVILIAHRLSTVESCDQIAVIEKGRVVGIGSYKELIKSNSLFKALALKEV